MARGPVPAVGRIVHFKSTYPEETWNGGEPVAAVITRVFSETEVGLTVFPWGEPPQPFGRVQLEGSFETFGLGYRVWSWAART